MRPLPARVLVAVALVTVLFVGGAPLVARAHVAADVAAQLLALTNAARTQVGVPPLVSDPALAAGARAWSAQMAASGVLAHGSFAVSGATRWAENVGRTDSADAASALHAAFMASSDHRANILEPAFTIVGIGVVVDGGTTWVTQRFAAAPVPEPWATVTAFSADTTSTTAVQTAPAASPAAAPAPANVAAPEVRRPGAQPAAARRPARARGTESTERPGGRRADMPGAQPAARTIAPPASARARVDTLDVGGRGRGPTGARADERRNARSVER